MEKINNILCISHSELTSPDTGIMTVAALNWSVRKGELKRVQRGCRGQEAMYVVDSLPWKYKKIAMERFNIVEEGAKLPAFVDTIEQDGAAYNFYSTYELENGEHLKSELIEQYTNTASILNALKAVRDTANVSRAKAAHHRITSAEFWNNKAETLERVKSQYPHTLPMHPRSLSRVYTEYLKSGYSALISRKIANANATKIQTKEQISMLIAIIGTGNNFEAPKSAELYNGVASLMVPPWGLVTSRSVLRFTEKYKLEIAAARRGSNEFNNTLAMQHKRSAPITPMQYWTLDGWDAELYYQKTFTNQKGHKLTTYTNRVTIVIVLDPFNKYPIGYAIGDSETPTLIKEALKNAINHTQELFGDRYRTAQIQSDRYGIKTLTPIYSVVADKVTPARAHNAKAKVIEPYFGYFNKKYCQLMPNWSGFGITSRKHLQPNDEKLNKNKKSFPDREGVAVQLSQFIEFERNLKGEAYVNGFNALDVEKRLPLNNEVYLLNFGETTGRQNTIEGCGMRPTIGGIKRDYDCFDRDFRKYTHLRWKVLYDTNDLSQALAVSEDGKKRFMLEQKYIQPMALVDRTEADTKELARVNGFNKELKEHVTTQFCLAEATARQVILENPALHNTLAKTLITNSLGQHKDQRNDQRKRLEEGEGEGLVDITKPKAAKAKKQRAYEIEAIISGESKSTRMTAAELRSMY